MKGVFGDREIPVFTVLGEADRAHTAGNLDKAEHLYLKVIDREPGNFVARFLSGIIRFQRGDFQGSLDALNGVAGTDAPPADRARALLHIAHALRHLNRLDEALEACTRAVMLEPGFALASFVRADLFYRTGRYAESWRDYQDVKRLSPDLITEALTQRMNELSRLQSTGSR